MSSDKEKKEIIDALEVKGQFILADNLRKVYADKVERRKSKISAINLAAALRDKLENIAKKVLEKKVGSGINDIFSLLDSEFDRLEDKITKILTDYLEYKSNKDSVPENENEETETEKNEYKTKSVEKEKEPTVVKKDKKFEEPKIIDEKNIKNVEV